MKTLHEQITAMGERAVTAARELAMLGARQKSRVLAAMAGELEKRARDIKKANGEDMKEARAAGLSEAMLDRLALDDARIEGMANGLREVAGLRDPVGAQISRWVRPNGLDIVKVRVPIGVIGIIYEARPNVTADAAGLCIKTSNAVILRGGSEAMRSNAAIVEALQAGGKTRGLPDNSIQLIGSRDRAAVRELVRLEGVVDLVIPRGGESLIRAVTDEARVPVIKHYKGVCHVYVDAGADLDMALSIVENAKCQRPGVCNAIEKVLVHKDVAAQFLPVMAKRLEGRGVELRGDPAARKLAPSMKAAVEQDWYEEYLALILAVKVVNSVEDAIGHINRCGSRHSDAIVTRHAASRDLFLRDVDSACVYVNASTRFTDGGEFGMGAEIGISTDKLHARGPMGLEELTTYKYLIYGKGQIRG